MRWLRAVAASGVLLTASAVVAWPAVAATKDVSIDDVAFDPANITIKEGDTVRWTNDEAALGPSHNIRSDQVAQMSSPDLPPNGGQASRYSFTFGPNTAGTYSYYCSIHGKATMSGSIKVEAGPPTTTTTVRPTTTTARATTTTRRVTTSSSVDTSTTLEEESTTTTEESTTTTEADLTINEDNEDGASGAAIGLLVMGILAVLGGGGYLLYRMRAGRF